MSQKTYWSFYTLFLSLAVFMRLYHLSLIPEGLFNDEGLSGNDALRSLANMDFRAFYDNGAGREGMLVWTIAFFQFFLEPSVFSLRLAPACIGIETVAFIPFAVQSLFSFFNIEKDENVKKNAQIIGLATMFFLAISFWHINFSRIAFRAILDPLFAVIAVALLCRTFLSKSLFFLSILTGLVLGLGFYGYGSFKFLFLPLAFLIVLAFIRKDLQGVFKKAITIGIVAVLVMMPLTFYILNHSELYFYRLNLVSIFTQESPLSAFFNSFYKTLAMFFMEGDANERHNIPGYPALHTMVFAFLLLGFWRMISAFFKKERQSPIPKNLSIFLVLWWLSMILPSAFTFEGQPHFLRSIGMVPPTMIIAAIGSVFFLQRLRDSFAAYSRVKVFNLSLTGIALIMVVQSYVDYFHLFPSDKDHGFSFNQSARDAGLFITDPKNSTYTKYMVVKDVNKIEENWYMQTVLYLTKGDLDSYNVQLLDLESLKKVPLGENYVVFCLWGDYYPVVETVENKSKILLY